MAGGEDVYEETFETGIEKSVAWYLANRAWWNGHPRARMPGRAHRCERRGSSHAQRRWTGLEYRAVRFRRGGSNSPASSLGMG